MSQLVIELPDTLSQQLSESGLNQKQLQALVGRFIQLYLYRENLPDVKSQVENLLIPTNGSSNRPRFGSGKHLNITMSDDFDEPLEDFAEYMQ